VPAINATTLIMDNSFFAYLQQLELMVFFSGYALVYTSTLFIASYTKTGNAFTHRLVLTLPYSYAMLGTLYLAYMLSVLYPDYSIENITLQIQSPWLVAWGFLSICFWIPLLAKKKFLSLLHSLVFFFLLLRHLLSQFIAPAGNSFVKNDMQVYTTSMILNILSLVFLVMLSFLFFSRRRHLQS
jgi:hypothetical protein